MSTPEGMPPAGEPPTGPAGPPPEMPVIAWARAILGGIKDTAQDMLDEGRRGARDAYDEGWHRYEAKTKYRRKPRG